MVRILIIILLSGFIKIAYPQQFYTDHGTPLLPPVPCNCSNWRTLGIEKVDSSTFIVDSLIYEKEGKKYKRIYYVTSYDTTWKDICDEPANCKGAYRTRVTTGLRLWYTDKLIDSCTVTGIWVEYGVEAAKEKPWWAKVIAASEKTRDLLKKIPAAIKIEGPSFSGSYKERDCCKETTKIVNGESELSASLSIGVHANDLPCLSPPWTATFKKDITLYGYTVGLEVSYGLFASLGIDLKGEVAQTKNDCEGKSCLEWAVGLDVPVSFAIKAALNACVKKSSGSATTCAGVTDAGLPCKNITLNLCGYCYLHTSQSWWCIPCIDINLTPASISTNFYGKYESKCDAPPGFKFGIGKVVFKMEFKIWKFSTSLSYTITEGMDF
jgi:hypothetical protein